MRWGLEGSREKEETQAGSNSPNSSRIDRRSNCAGWSPDGLQSAHSSAHTKPDSVVASRGLLGAERVGVAKEYLKQQPQDSAKDVDTPLWKY